MRLTKLNKNSLGRRTTVRNQLAGKVVLLIGNDAATLQTLVMRLAQKGADIALFCQQLPAETLHFIKSQVEALGRNLLLLNTNEAETTQSLTYPIEYLIQKVILELGRLDIFIDLSAKKAKDEESENRVVTKPIKPSWNIRQAIFAELAQAN